MYVSANEAALYYCIIVKYLSFVVYVNDIILMYNILIYMVRKIIVNIYMMISICGDSLICSTTVKILLKVNLFFSKAKHL